MRSMTITNNPFVNILILLLMLVSGCGKEVIPPEPAQHLVITFSFFVDGSPLQRDTMIYINEAGNHYLVNEIQFFISDVTLHRASAPPVILNQWKAIHYIDSDMPETHIWNVFDALPAATYDSVSFTFGIDEEKNQSLMYLNPPESFMFWPEYLGGGYHYLKLNGKWLDTNNLIRPFNFHLGIGQIYAHYPDSIIGFIQNYFTVTLPSSGFTLIPDETDTLKIVMNIENWFRDPHTYDHNEWGGDIMQKQEAMKLGCENGWNVFSCQIKN